MKHLARHSSARLLLSMPQRLARRGLILALVLLMQVVTVGAPPAYG